MAGRLARIHRECTPDQLKELRELAGGKSLPDLAADLLRACDADAHIERAKSDFDVAAPSEAQLAQAAERLAQEAVTPLLKAALRRRILEIRAQNEQTIDRHSIDAVKFSAFDPAAVDKARAQVQDFRTWIDKNRDQLTALQAIYAGVKPLKLSLKDLRKLRDALAAPPLATTPTQLWRAFTLVEATQINESRAGANLPGEPLADLVALIRHAITPARRSHPMRVRFSNASRIG